MFERIKELLARRQDEREVREIARRAADWLEDDTLNMALAGMRNAALNTWISSPDPVVQSRAWYEMHRISLFTRELRRLVENERVATATEARARKPVI